MANYGKAQKMLIEIGASFCLGVILENLVFIRSLNAYRIVSESEYWFLTVLFCLLPVPCIWCCNRYRFQPILRFAGILIGFFTSLNINVHFRVLLRVCEFYHVDAESNMQGFIDGIGFLAILIVGFITVVLRMIHVKFKLNRNCVRYFENGRFQLLYDTQNAAKLYDAAYKEVVLSDIETYRYTCPYLLAYGKEGYVIVDTAFGRITYADTMEKLPEHMKKRFDKSKDQKV